LLSSRLCLVRLLPVLLQVASLLLCCTCHSCHASSSSSSSSSSSRWVSSSSSSVVTGLERRWRTRSRRMSQSLRTSSSSSSTSLPTTTYRSPITTAAATTARRNNKGLWGLSSARRRRSHLLAATATSSSTSNRALWVAPAHAATKTKSSTTRQGKGDFPLENDPDEASFAQLGPVGKVVAGSIEIALSTLLEFMSGFVGGYFLGTLTGLPAFVTKPAETAAASSSSSFWRQFQQRAVRMHTKSFQWGSSWGGISAAFGGFRVTTKVLRNGKEDEWSTIFSSMAAGAYFARKDGPAAMLKGAVMYGGLMYLLSGNLMEKKQPFQYTEETIDF